MSHRLGGQAAVLQPAVRAWLARQLPGQAVVAATLLGGGYSNENILVITGRGRYVLRRYRRGSGPAPAPTCAVGAAPAARPARTARPRPPGIRAAPRAA